MNVFAYVRNFRVLSSILFLTLFLQLIVPLVGIDDIAHPEQQGANYIESHDTVRSRQKSAKDVDSKDASANKNSQAALFVDKQKTQKERSQFIEALRNAGRDKRGLYERYIDVIGANGILDGIEFLNSACHSEAHDLGKVIYARTKNIGQSLKICADRCFSGCMHGVLMEAFTRVQRGEQSGDLQFRTLKPVINHLCRENRDMTASYSPGDCAHGIGHALMYIAAYDIPKAIDGCNELKETAMKYYCVTGAYMEYVTERDAEDARSKGVFYPCDSYAYPSACSRYKMGYVALRHYGARKSLHDLIKMCRELEGKFRLACFHGLGNAHMGAIGTGNVSITEVCLQGTAKEQFVCIEGAMERMGKYYGERALIVCEDLKTKNNEACVAAVKNKMYNMKKDLSLYIQ